MVSIITYYVIFPNGNFYINLYIDKLGLEQISSLLYQSRGAEMQPQKLRTAPGFTTSQNTTDAGTSECGKMLTKNGPGLKVVKFP